MPESVEKRMTTALGNVAGDATKDAVAHFLERESGLIVEFPRDTGPARDRVLSDIAKLRAERDSQLRVAQSSLLAAPEIGRLREILHRYDDRVITALRDNPINELGVLRTCRQWLDERIAGYRATLAAFDVSDAPNASEPRAFVATHVDEVSELLHDSTVPSEATQRALRAVRRQRDAGLRLYEIASRAGSMTRIHAALIDYDTAVDELIGLAASMERTVSDVQVEQATRLLAARIKNDDSAERRWLWVWFAAAGLGLAAIVGAFSAGSRSGDLGWASASIVLAGLGALLAAGYTYAGTGGSPWWTRTLLIALPFTVFTLALVLPGMTVEERTISSLLASLVVVGLAGVSTWIVWRDHNRSVPSTTQTPLIMSIPRTDPRQVAGTPETLIGELDMMRRRIAEEAHSQMVAARWWAATFIAVGGLAALLSGAAGVNAAQGQTGLSDWIAPLAIAGAGLTALTTALNPGRRWEQAQTLRLACQSLEHEVRVLLRVDLPGGGLHGREKLEEIAIKYDTLLGVPERPRLWTPPNRQGQ
jgi:hypothetical protein